LDVQEDGEDIDFIKITKNTHEYVIIILETSKMLKLEHMKNLGNVFYSMEKKK
jgi:hypothetical protein